MDAEDYSLPQTTGKIRVRGGHGGRNRPKPYLRKDPKKSSKEKPKEETNQGFLSKVSSYIVPKWISSWFTSKEKESPVQEESSEEECDSNDETEHKKASAETSNQLTGNHVSHERTIKNLTSTPMVGNPAPFSIIRSDVVDPLEGTSTTVHKEPAILDGRSLLLSEISGRKSKEQQNEPSASVKYPFRIGTSSGQTPQRFVTSRNKPSFKVSSFLSSSPLIPSGSSSAFYPGQTSYGGASSIQIRNTKRQRMSPVAANVQTKRANIKPKSLATSKTGAVTSDTARKILGALERMSSPVRDASKLPSSPSSVLFNPVKRKTEFSFTQSSHRTSLNPSQPIVSFKGSDIFRTQQTSNLEETNVFTSKFKIGDSRPGVSVGTFKSRGLPTSFSPENGDKPGGKMKRQRQVSHYASAAPEVEEEPVNKLPAIKQAVPLPISSLPKFDFSSSSKVTSAGKLPESTVKISTNKASSASEPEMKKSSSLFKFSQPEKIADKNQGQKVTELAKSKFQFSAPFSKDQAPGDNAKQSLTESEMKQSIATTCDNLGKDKQFNTVVSQSSISAEKSNTDPNEKSVGLKSNIWNQPKDQWECDTCMLMNKPDRNTCIACEAARPGKTESAQNNMKPSSLAAMFKPEEGSWECGTCMVRNKKENVNCVACNEKKPGSEASKIDSNSKGEQKSAFTGVFAKFAPKTGSWECETCMISNTPEATACAACSTPKPGATGASESSSVSSASGAKFVFGSTSSSSASSTSSSVTFGQGSGFKFGSGTVRSSVKFGDDGKKGFNFGTSDGKGFSFGNKEDKGVSFGSGDSKKISFGTKDGNSTSDGKNITFGISDGKSAKSDTKDDKVSSVAANDSKNVISSAMDNNAVSFGAKSGEGFVFGTNNKNDVNKDNKNITFSFGSSAKPELSMKTESKPEAVTAKGFSFGTSQSKTSYEAAKVSEPSAVGVTKTEENNNKIITETKAAAILSAVKEPKAAEPQEKKNPAFPTIADAAQAGFLKVPEIQSQDESVTLSKGSFGEQKQDAPKLSFGVVPNGPVPNAFGIHSAMSSESNKSTSMSSAPATISTTPVFNFTAPKTQAQAESTSQFSQPSKGFSFGGSQNSATIFGTQKDTTSQATNTTTSAAPVFAFGNTSEPKATNLFGNSKSQMEGLDKNKPFNFTSSESKTLGPSLFQNKPQENMFKFSKNEENKLSSATPMFTNSTQSQPNTAAVKSNFSSPFQFKTSEPVNNPFGMPNAAVAPSGGFSFGNNTNTTTNSASLFGKPASENMATNNMPGGLSFGSVPPVPDTSLFTEKVDQTLVAPAKPFSFTAPVTNDKPSSANPAAGGFQFGAKPFSAGSNVFGSGAVNQAPAPSGGFNFTNNTQAAGGFNFSGSSNNTPTPMFSSGAPSSAGSNRPIKKAVRRRK